MTSQRDGTPPAVEVRGGIRVLVPEASRDWFARRSTGTKLVLLLLGVLLPLGIIALLATLESARANAASRQAAATAISRGSARSLDVLIARTELTLRTAATALAGASDPARCRTTLDALAATHAVRVQFALFDRAGRLRCATAGAPTVAPSLHHMLDISPDGKWLNVSTGPIGDARGPAGPAIGIARFNAATVSAVAHPPQGVQPYRLMVRDADGDAFMALGSSASRLEGRLLTASSPVAGALWLDLTVPAQRLRASEMLGLLLPILMLVAAGLLSWLTIDRLMLRPLEQLEAAVLGYRGGDRVLRLPQLTTPATEIRSLAGAFGNMVDTIARYEADLEESLGRQTRLTREVHHRVKNNLQVVASLLNLHARAATSPEATAAYAAIQRRVDALAVVHRNHYAEMEENRGVPLRPLIGELAANLRANAPVAAAAMPILLDVEPLYAHQDVAVPVAFIVTELVEWSMLRHPREPVTIRLSSGVVGRAALQIGSMALRSGADEEGDGDQDHERVERVLFGLSRQLRATAARNEEAGTFGIDVSVLPR